MFYPTSTIASVHAHMQISVQSFKKRYKLPLSVHATGINIWHKRKEKHLFINLDQITNRVQDSFHIN